MLARAAIVFARHQLKQLAACTCKIAFARRTLPPFCLQADRHKTNNTPSSRSMSQPLLPCNMYAHSHRSHVCRHTVYMHAQEHVTKWTCSLGIFGQLCCVQWCNGWMFTHCPSSWNCQLGSCVQWPDDACNACMCTCASSNDLQNRVFATLPPRHVSVCIIHISGSIDSGVHIVLGLVFALLLQISSNSFCNVCIRWHYYVFPSRCAMAPSNVYCNSFLFFWCWWRGVGVAIDGSPMMTRALLLAMSEAWIIPEMLMQRMRLMPRMMPGRMQRMPRMMRRMPRINYARRQPRRMQKICHSERIGSSFWNSNPAHRVITIGSLLLSPCTFIDSYNCW